MVAFLVQRSGSLRRNGIGLPTCLNAQEKLRFTLGLLGNFNNRMTDFDSRRPLETDDTGFFASFVPEMSDR